MMKYKGSVLDQLVCKGDCIVIANRSRQKKKSAILPIKPYHTNDCVRTLRNRSKVVMLSPLTECHAWWLGYPKKQAC